MRIANGCRFEVLVAVAILVVLCVFGFTFMHAQSLQQSVLIDSLRHRVDTLERSAQSQAIPQDDHSTSSSSSNGNSRRTNLRQKVQGKSKPHPTAEPTPAPAEEPEKEEHPTTDVAPQPDRRTRLSCKDRKADDEKRIRVSSVRAVEPHPAYSMATHAVPDVVSTQINARGSWEPWIVQQLRAVFGPSVYTAPTPSSSDPNSGLVEFVDIGANIGFFTSLTANMGLQVLAIEPFGLNTPLILHTLCQLNPEFSPRVRLHKAALTDTVGGDMCLWSTNTQVNNGNARLTPYFEGKKTFDQDQGKECMERIRSFTLDHLLFSAIDGPHLSNRPRALKIDIEGFETIALRGGKRFLSQYAPCYLFFEYQRMATMTSGAGEREIFDMLTKAGYQFYLHQGSSMMKPVQAPDYGGCTDMCDYSAYLASHADECGASVLDAFSTPMSDY